MRRRDFLRTTAAAGAAAALVGCRRQEDDDRPRWSRDAYVKPKKSKTAVLAAAGYDADLVDVVRRGVKACEVHVRNRRVVLKPNLVEFDPQGVINTHPALIAAAIEAFRSMGARSVTVAEGPGHRRDNDYLLTASGLDDAIQSTGSRYVDLNFDRTSPLRARSAYTALGTLHLPRTVTEAELFVSMPKLKTHHWAGMTLSMKNLFGTLPGSRYGWPKNVLHYAGLHESILDINATIAVPRFNIVDGIVGMEGNGPIQGTARMSGVVVFGEDPVAVDATGARLMKLDPWKIQYLSEADRFMGNVAEERIEQLAEDPDRFAQDYAVLDAFRFLKASSMAASG